MATPNIDTERENALLKATLKEIIRIEDTLRDKADDPEEPSIDFGSSLDGKTERQWNDIMRKARLLVRP